jgi:hypothetical protein
MTDGSNTAPTMGAPLSFSTNSAGNVVLHIKNENGLIRATFMYFITQDYLGSGGITIQVNICGRIWNRYRQDGKYGTIVLSGNFTVKSSFKSFRKI